MLSCTVRTWYLWLWEFPPVLFQTWTLLIHKYYLENINKKSSSLLWNFKKNLQCHHCTFFLFSKTTIDKEKVKKRKNKKWKSHQVQSKFAKSLMWAGLSEPGVQVKTWHPQILEDQLTLFQPEGLNIPTKLLLSHRNNSINV